MEKIERLDFLKINQTHYLMKLLIYEIHIFELRNEEINVKKILAVINATYAVAKRINDQLPVGLIAQLVRALHRYRRGQGSNPGKPDFFRLSFRNCISCVNNCEDLRGKITCFKIYLHKYVQ